MRLNRSVPHRSGYRHPMRLSIERARQIAVMAQLLAADRPTDLVDTVRRQVFVQIDPTSIVARTEHLVLWSRLGDRFRPDDLAQALFVDRSLFEYAACIYAATDYPQLRPGMEAWPAGTSGWEDRVREWMTRNAAFRAYVLDELRRRGPLRSRELEDRSVVGWQSTGWTHDRNVGQMLEFLSARGEIAIARRDGQERVWDVAERVLPVDAPLLAPDDAARLKAERRLRAHGIVRPRSIAGLGDLGLEVEVDGTKGIWRIDPDLLDRPFAGRTAVLSPFDRLIYDRKRALELFGFDYKLEIYVPVAKRRWGYYVLPILRGDRMIAKADARTDRVTGVLRVNVLHLEDGTNADDREAAVDELASLGLWLGLDGVLVERTVSGAA